MSTSTHHADASLLESTFSTSLCEPTNTRIFSGFYARIRMMSTGGEPLLIIGASARAAAESARRAGYRPYAIDLFADADLVDIAEVRRSRSFPHDLLALARTMPACDWLYVGGLENYPDVVEALAAERRLLGVSGDILRRVRDPRLLGHAMCMHGVSMPESIFDSAELCRVMATDSPAGSRPGTSGSTLEGLNWLVKQRRSSAGLGVAPLRQVDLVGLSEATFADGRYLQRRTIGVPMGAIYLATAQATYLLGVSEQLTCPCDDGSLPFRYAGSVGLRLAGDKRDTWLRDNLEKIGRVATSVFPMSGIFSLDFLLDAGSGIRPLEINPRYTASVELIERSCGRSLVALHAAACRGEPVEVAEGLPIPHGSRANPVHGKRIVYATAKIEHFPAKLTAELLQRRRDAECRGEVATVADIPPVGTKIAKEEPIATVFASGSDENEVKLRLMARETELREWISSMTPTS